MDELIKILENKCREIERDFRDLKNDYDKLKQDFNDMRIEHAQAMERQRALITSIDKIETAIGRLIWLVAGGFVSAAVMWVINGGLSQVGLS